MTRLKVPGQGASAFTATPVTHLKGTYHDRWLDEGKKKICFFASTLSTRPTEGHKRGADRSVLPTLRSHANADVSVNFDIVVQFSSSYGHASSG